MKKNYFKELSGLLSNIEVRDREGKRISPEAAIAKIVKLILSQSKKMKKVFLVGNGGSAAIASHVAIDLLKNAGVPALAFNDPSFLTSLSNDLGFEYVFVKPLEMLADKDDILFAISSSGRSKNILNASKAARQKGSFLITLSGFSPDNPLRRLGEINFYLPSDTYGYVEIAHLAICHYIVDDLMSAKKAAS